VAARRAIPDIQNHQVRDLLGRNDAAFTQHAAQVGERFSCRIGCDGCCHGPFDVSELDLWLTVEGIVTQPDDVRRRTLRRIRAAASVQRAWLEQQQGPLPERIGVDEVGEDAFDAMCDALVSQACPLLEDGRCTVHYHRPEPCRLRGVAWVGEDDILDFGCPEGLNAGGEGPISGYVDVSGRLARLQHGLSVQGVGSGTRSTLALGLAELLGGAPAAASEPG